MSRSKTILKVIISALTCTILLFYFDQKHHAEQSVIGVTCISNFNIENTSLNIKANGEVHIRFNSGNTVSVYILGIVTNKKNTFTLDRELTLHYVIKDKEGLVISVTSTQTQNMSTDNVPDEIIKTFLYDKVIGNNELLQFVRFKNAIIIKNESSPIFTCVIRS
ncbi:MAG TPA: hypothetical protein VGH05_03795 [Buttiauxella sp.]